MTGAREEILARVQAALRDVPAAERPDDLAAARDYRREGDLREDQLIELLAQRIREYHADAHVVPAPGVPGAIARACAEMQLRRVVVPPGLPAHWRPSEVEVLDDIGLSTAAIDQLDGAITGCAVAIAETGTLVLDGRGASGRRVISLVPDNHICLVSSDQVVALVPEALARVAPTVREQAAAVTMISGPSASSDIELSRVEGVHGPRHLRVLIVTGDR